jgi:hypothetical protein
MTSENGAYLQRALGPVIEKFTLKVEEINNILGIEVKRNVQQRTVMLTQCGYIENVTEMYGGYLGAEPHDTPSETARRISSDDCPQSEEERKEMSKYPFRALVGALHYLANTTRPDLAEAVGAVAQFGADPGKKHWEAALRIVGYLKVTSDWGLSLGGEAPVLTCFADASFMADPERQRSRSGFLVLYGRGPVAWRSALQGCTATSTAGSEYFAMEEAARDVTWLRTLFEEIDAAQEGPTVMYEDNTAAQALAELRKASRKNRHILARYWAVQDCVEKGYVKVMRCDTTDMQADLLTKPLARDRFRELRSRFMAGNV